MTDLVIVSEAESIVVVETVSPEVIEVLTAGPVGPKGDKGDKGDLGDVNPLSIQAVSDAQNYAYEASVSAAIATTKASEAISSASNAAASANTASSAATSASGNASTANTKAIEAAGSATAAASAATSASGSATAASVSASTATTKASESATSSSNAAGYATTAAASATAAATSEANALTSKNAAATSASTASTKASEASASATAAAASATTASTKALDAAGSATAAATSETGASTSAATATTKATDAATSASSAATYAINAATSETNALSYKNSASTSATTATTQAGIATTKAGEAATSATNALASASAAATSESNALSYKNTAGSYATTATAQAGIATTQAGTATTQAGIATTKAGEASTSASAASSAQAAAEAARDQTLSAFDSFDDRYLGAKPSDPTTDNDGNVLDAGALYYCTATGSEGMKVYTGLAWVAAYISGAGTLIAANNLSDLENTHTARANLGLSAVAESGSYSDLTGTPALFSGSYADLTEKPTLFSGVYGDLTEKPIIPTVPTTVSSFTNDIGYITSYTETDPVFVASPAHGITSTNITNWNMAYGWGNHASAGYLTTITEAQVTAALGYTPINYATKGAANGVASLDASGLVPSSQLPSYVDDVLEYANFAALPATGESGKIYVLDTPYTTGGITSSQFRWGGSVYVAIIASPGSTDSVTEGTTNLYFTLARARGSFSASQNLSYDPSTGAFTGPDLSGYLTSSAAATAYQSVLVSGTNIKTINGASVLGSGDITVADLQSQQTLLNKTLTGLKETKVAMTGVNIDCSAANYFTKTFTAGAVSLTMSNIPASGVTAAGIVETINAGLATITYPTGSKWAGGTAPTLTSSGKDVLGWYVNDGGTTINWFVMGKDVK